VVTIIASEQVMLILFRYGNNLCIPNEVMKKPEMMTLKHEAILANWMYVTLRNVAGQEMPTDFTSARMI
jgi:hypothetical protein